MDKYIEPVFEIMRMSDGHKITIYLDGKVEGLEYEFVVFNKFKILHDMLLAKSTRPTSNAISDNLGLVQGTAP